jgi:putative ABC transport system permease protein
MIRNYIKIALRNIGKYPFISFINLFGLTIGMTSCLLIFAYVNNELSFDRFNRNADRIYRVTRSFYSPDGSRNLDLSAVAPPFGPLLKNYFPDIQEMTRVLPKGNTTLRYKEKLFNEPAASYADPRFFDFFTVPILRGNPKTALTDPYTVMMTPEIAAKYFGREDPVGKVLSVDNIRQQFQVTGIYQDFPANSHFHPSLLISFNTLKDSSIYGEKTLLTDFGNNAFYTYLKFPQHYPVNRIEAQFPAFLDRNLNPPGQQPKLKASQTTSLSLQKLTDIHLHSHLDDEMEENGDIDRVYIFAGIAVFILLIACINYMNLASARSTLRAREIGVRKAVGAQRREIVLQFLSESVVLTCMSMILALVLTRLCLPYLNQLADREISFEVFSRPFAFLTLLALPFVVGILSGIYPALFMSSFRPVTVLKGLIKVGTGNISFRRALVVMQFAISIILIIATVIVFQQLSFIENKSLGYDKNQVIILQYPRETGNQFESFRSQLLRDPHFRFVSRSSRIPTGRLLDDMEAETEMGDKMQPLNIDLKFITADYDFIPAYGMKLVAGRNFSRSMGNDSASFILNETSVREMGWKSPQFALNRNMIYGGTPGKVIGVVQDFNFESLHQKIVPLLIGLPPPDQQYYNRLSIKITGTEVPAAVDYLKKTWQRFFPQTPFDFTFLSDRFTQLYDAEQKEGSIFSIFSGIAIFIACLGLFGLSSFTIMQRIKEIGIRKVLGASMANIVTMLSSDFLKLIVLAAVIALPVAWMSMHKWLGGFAYHIQIHSWVLIAATCCAGAVALGTVSIQAIKASMSNPVKSLGTD